MSFITKAISSYCNFANGEKPRKQLLRGGLGSIIIKAVHITLTFFLSIVLARFLGAAGFGVYSFAYALVMVLAIPAQVGLPQLVLRETAKAHASANWRLMYGVWRWSTLAILFFSFLITVACAILIWLLNKNFSEEGLTTILMGLALVPLIALGGLRGAALSGLRHVVLGQLPEGVIRPTILLVLVFLSAIGILGLDITPPNVMAMHALAAFVAFVMGAILLKKLQPYQSKVKIFPVYKTKQWIGSAIPLALVGGLQLVLVYSDIIMLGMLSSDKEVGVYRAVAQMSLLIGVGLDIAHMLIAPYLSRYHAQGNTYRLQKIIKTSTQAVFITTAPILILFILFGEQLLALTFGTEFVIAYTALIILSLGKFLSASLGPVGLVLQMTGYEKEAVAGLALAAVLNIVLNLILIPWIGISGAALATAFSSVVSHVALNRFVLLRLNVEASVIPYSLLTLVEKGKYT